MIYYLKAHHYIPLYFLSAAITTTTFYSFFQHSVTCVSLTADDSTIYSGSKDNSLIRWDAETGKKQVLREKWSRQTHVGKNSEKGEILSVAVSSDGRYVVSGGRDAVIRIYDSRMASAEVQALQGHRDAVTCLAFRRDSYSLFSGSLDRCLKHWDLNEMAYLETLFGHQVRPQLDYNTLF